MHIITHQTFVIEIIPSSIEGYNLKLTEKKADDIYKILQYIYKIKYVHNKLLYSKSKLTDWNLNAIIIVQKQIGHIVHDLIVGN